MTCNPCTICGPICTCNTLGRDCSVATIYPCRYQVSGNNAFADGLPQGGFPWLCSCWNGPLIIDSVLVGVGFCHYTGIFQCTRIPGNVNQFLLLSKSNAGAPLPAKWYSPDWGFTPANLQNFQFRLGPSSVGTVDAQNAISIGNVAVGGGSSRSFANAQYLSDSLVPGNYPAGNWIFGGAVQALGSLSQQGAELYLFIGLINTSTNLKTTLRALAPVGGGSVTNDDSILTQFNSAIALPGFSVSPGDRLVLETGFLLANNLAPTWITAPSTFDEGVTPVTADGVKSPPSVQAYLTAPFELLTAPNAITVLVEVSLYADIANIYPSGPSAQPGTENYQVICEMTLTYPVPNPLPTTVPLNPGGGKVVYVASLLTWNFCGANTMTLLAAPTISGQPACTVPTTITVTNLDCQCTCDETCQIGPSTTFGVPMGKCKGSPCNWYFVGSGFVDQRDTNGNLVSLSTFNGFTFVSSGGNVDPLSPPLKAFNGQASLDASYSSQNAEFPPNNYWRLSLFCNGASGVGAASAEYRIPWDNFTCCGPNTFSLFNNRGFQWPPTITLLPLNNDCGCFCGPGPSPTKNSLGEEVDMPCTGSEWPCMVMATLVDLDPNNGFPPDTIFNTPFSELLGYGGIQLFITTGEIQIQWRGTIQARKFFSGIGWTGDDVVVLIWWSSLTNNWQAKLTFTTVPGGVVFTLGPVVANTFNCQPIMGTWEFTQGSGANARTYQLTIMEP